LASPFTISITVLVVQVSASGILFLSCAQRPSADKYPVSSCHGAGDDPIAPECCPSRFFNILPSAVLTISDYTDLVTIELDDDDKPHVIFSADSCTKY
jgi:hypothetical protein